MIANVPWYDMYSACGMFVDRGAGSSPTPFNSALDRSPIHALPVLNAREYPRSAHTIPTKPREMKLIIIVLRAFLERTRPP